VSGALAVLGLLLGACGDEEAPLAPDQTPPAIVRFEPADGAVGIPTGIDTVRVLFDEPVTVPDLSSSLVVRGPDSPLPGRVALDSTATILSFASLVPYTVATEYTITLGAGIADLAGNARPDSVVTRFTTSFAFSSIGRVFTANQLSRNLTVLDLTTYDPVPGSPVPLDGRAPIRLETDPATGEVYTLYTVVGAAGILVVDGRTLAVLRDSGPILPVDAVDLALAPDHDLVLVVSPGGSALHVFDATTLAPARAPYHFPRPDARPVRVTVAHRFDYALVALDGGAELAGLELPELTPAHGFPTAGAPRAHTILVDEPRARAWVGGSNRYAVVDLINPDRVQSFQMPACPCFSLWTMILDPISDRVYFADRYDFVLAVVASNLDPAPESPGNVRFIHVLQDLAQDPRTGNLIVLGWRNLESPLMQVRNTTLSPISSTRMEVGDNALDVEVLP
jgi:hypothetical protein